MTQLKRSVLEDFDKFTVGRCISTQCDLKKNQFVLGFFYMSMDYNYTGISHQMRFIIT